MRVAIAVVAVLLLWPHSVAAEETNVRPNPGGDGVEYGGKDPGSGGGGGGGSGSGGYYSEHLVLRSNDGEPCVATEYRRHDTAAEAQAAQREEDQRIDRNAYYYFRPCPEESGPPQESSASMAREFWGTVPLPKPGPRIEPGWAVTGRKSYLETGSTPTARFTRDTPRGELVIDATGPYYVDWGDGTVGGPYNEPGLPWPDGKITHVYERVGSYDVVVTQRWSATWTLGSESGRLGGLRTEGRIDDFPAEELQAVRNR